MVSTCAYTVSYFTQSLPWCYSGTGSVRATLVRHDGSVLATSSQSTTTFRDKSDHRIFEQSTTDIWKGIASSIQACLAEANVSPSMVKGLGIDATCSLAVSDDRGQPITVTKGNNLGLHGERNVILWADHRAEAEAELINASGSIVLNYVGGTMSVSLLAFSLIKVNTIIFLVRNGDTKGSLAQETHVTSTFRSLPLLRFARLSCVCLSITVLPSNLLLYVQ